MSVVKINVLEVPEGKAEVLEERFAARAGEVDKVDGFESFDLLRPTEGTDRYLVVTKWRDEASFRAWMDSAAFQRGHARSGEDAGSRSDSPNDAAASHPHAASEGGQGGAPSGGPAAVGSQLWGFEVVVSSQGQNR